MRWIRLHELALTPFAFCAQTFTRIRTTRSSSLSSTRVCRSSTRRPRWSRASTCPPPSFRLRWASRSRVSATSASSTASTPTASTPSTLTSRSPSLPSRRRSPGPRATSSPAGSRPRIPRTASSPRAATSRSSTSAPTRTSGATFRSAPPVESTACAPLACLACTARR